MIYVREISRFQSNVPFLGHSRKPSDTFDQTDEPTIYSIAIDGLMKELGLKESEKKLLEGHIELREAHPGVTILTEGKNEVSCIRLQSSQSKIYGITK